jgi:hypothetical protein
MQKSGLMVIVAALALIALPGCLKWYCCGNTTYYYKCNKGINVVYTEITGNAASIEENITDTLNMYRTSGYVCGFLDTTPPYTTCVQGEMHKKSAEAAGQPCVNSDQGLCSAAADPQCGN